jgi:hypothetical protein
MKLKWKIGIAVPMAGLIIAVACWLTMDSFREWARDWIYFAQVETRLMLHPPPPRCKMRQAEFNSQADRLEANAMKLLKMGTKKREVVQFFESENIPVTFEPLDQGYEAVGTIYLKGDAGCFSLACGDDAALIGVRVDVDEEGTVISAPVVVGPMYTDCL